MLLALVLTFGSISLACGAKPAQTPTSLPPISTEPEIPANYTNYTDEAKLFSIAYPPDWETALSLIADIDKNTKEVISSLQSGLPVEKASIIFFAGLRTAEGYDPSVNIVVEPLLEGISTHDQMVEAEIQGAQNLIQDYRELSRVKTTVGGREATILDWDGTYPGQVKRHSLQMITLVDKTTWVVGCSATIDDFAKWENDFNAIIRSLRISNEEKNGKTI